MLKRLFKKDPLDEPARTLYARIVDQARQPAFYRHLGVPDSLDGRFELVILHVFLALRRLRSAGTDSTDFGQHLFDVMFQDMDQCLREIGVGDTGVSIRIKRMVEGFYGRVAAYDSGLDNTDDTLEEALTRNLYGTVTPRQADLDAVAAYIRREVAALDGQDPADLCAGQVRFGTPPVSAPVVPSAPVEGQ